MQPKIGDAVIHLVHRLELTSFPDKLGLAPGACYEATLTMTANDERAWESRTLKALILAFRREHKKDPDDAELKTLRIKSKLRPTETLISRETGLPFQKPRVMRHTGLVADLCWDSSQRAWRSERRVEQREFEHPERRAEVTRGE